MDSTHLKRGDKVRCIEGNAYLVAGTEYVIANNTGSHVSLKGRENTYWDRKRFAKLK